jgi:hypothetical protein
MRKRYQIEGSSFVTYSERPADDFIEFFEWKKLSDGEFADGNDEIGLEQIDLIVHPARAISNFVRAGNSVATRGSFTREAATDGREVNRRANLILVHPTKFAEPTEESAPGCPGKRFPEDRFFHARRLTDQHHPAQDGSAGDWRRQHPRATAALPQQRDVLLEQLLFARRARHAAISGGRATGATSGQC